MIARRSAADVIAIVLAAGRGARMGGPKALLVVDGQPLIVQHLARLRALGCTRIVLAVPSAIADQVRGLVPDAEVPHAEVLGLDTASQAATLAASLQHVGSLEPLARVLLTPVDLQPPRLETLRALLACDGAAVFPRHAGKNGHPIVVRAGLLDPYREALAPPPLKQLLAGLRIALDVDDPAVLGDFDHHHDLPGRTFDPGRAGSR